MLEKLPFRNKLLLGYLSYGATLVIVALFTMYKNGTYFKVNI